MSSYGSLLSFSIEYRPVGQLVRYTAVWSFYFTCFSFFAFFTTSMRYARPISFNLYLLSFLESLKPVGLIFDLFFWHFGSFFNLSSIFANVSDFIGTSLITAGSFCQNGKLAVVGTYDGRCIFYDTEVYPHAH